MIGEKEETQEGTIYRKYPRLIPNGGNLPFAEFREGKGYKEVNYQPKVGRERKEKENENKRL